MMNWRNFLIFALLQLVVVSVCADISLKIPSQKVLNKKEEVIVEESPVFHREPLFYYKQFAAGMHDGGNGITMAELYEKERQLRKKIDENLNKIDELKRQRDIAKRDALHRENKFEQLALKSREKLHNVNYVFTQRETAIKFEINHDEMWKTYYDKRQKENKTKLTTAFKGEIPGINKLIRNDKRRIRSYHSESLRQWRLLVDLKARQKTEVSKLENDIDTYINEKAEAKLEGENKIQIFVQKIRVIEQRNKPLEKALKADLHLQKLMKKNENLEEKEVNTTKTEDQKDLRKEGTRLKPHIEKAASHAKTKNMQAKSQLERGTKLKKMAKKLEHTSS